MVCCMKCVLRGLRELLLQEKDTALRNEISALEANVCRLAEAIDKVAQLVRCDNEDPGAHEDTPLALAQLSDGLVVQHVRLSGLRTARLNGRVGRAVARTSVPGNWKVLLHNDPIPKSVHEDHLFKYVPLPGDLCDGCGGPLNLSAVPPCECECRPIRSATHE